MKNRILVLLVVLAMAVVAAPIRSYGQSEREKQRESRRDVDRDQDNDKDYQRDLSERDEINQTIELASGARVEVSGINGTVDIETGNTGVAEVHIVRSANNRADLDFHKIVNILDGMH